MNTRGAAGPRGPGLARDGIDCKKRIPQRHGQVGGPRQRFDDEAAVRLLIGITHGIGAGEKDAYSAIRVEKEAGLLPTLNQWLRVPRAGDIRAKHDRSVTAAVISR